MERRSAGTDLHGAILATSQSVTLPDGFNDFARFHFLRPVELQLGSIYFLEILRVSESGQAMIRGAVDDPCPAQRAWISGSAQQQADLWYQVGWDASIPGGGLNWGAWKSRW